MFEYMTAFHFTFGRGGSRIRSTRNAFYYCYSQTAMLLTLTLTPFTEHLFLCKVRLKKKNTFYCYRHFSWERPWYGHHLC